MIFIILTVVKNEYETAPYFIQLGQNMKTIVCLLLSFSPFLPEFTCFATKIVLNMKTKQFLAKSQLFRNVLLVSSD